METSEFRQLFSWKEAVIMIATCVLAAAGNRLVAGHESLAGEIPKLTFQGVPALLACFFMLGFIGHARTRNRGFKKFCFKILDGALWAFYAGIGLTVGLAILGYFGL